MHTLALIILCLVATASCICNEKNLTIVDGDNQVGSLRMRDGTLFLNGSVYISLRAIAFQPIQNLYIYYHTSQMLFPFRNYRIISKTIVPASNEVSINFLISRPNPGQTVYFAVAISRRGHPQGWARELHFALFDGWYFGYKISF